eukprot:365478-Chlamydomonas_euryale.AAC.1
MQPPLAIKLAPVCPVEVHLVMHGMVDGDVVALRRALHWRGGGLVLIAWEESVHECEFGGEIVREFRSPNRNSKSNGVWRGSVLHPSSVASMALRPDLLYPWCIHLRCHAEQPSTLSVVLFSLELGLVVPFSSRVVSGWPSDWSLIGGFALPFKTRL